MLVSYNWLQKFFDTPLPLPEDLAAALNSKSAEVDEVKVLAGDTMLDVKVLPDKSAWLMSHRGIAKEVATVLGLCLKNDPFTTTAVLTPETKKVTVATTTTVCDYYSAAFISGVTVGESPAWLQELLATIGQRSINNVVDITNYIMFGLGQPLHAFAADKLSGESKSIVVRTAKDREAFVSLTGESYSLSAKDTVITDGHTDAVLALAGVKGGVSTGIDESTKTIILESAHFDRVATRLSAQRNKLPTDAAKRYENGVPKDLAAIALKEATALICEIAGGELHGFAVAGDEEKVVRPAVSVSLARVNSMLGIELKESEVTAVFDKLGYPYQIVDGLLRVEPPWERDDLVIPEDLIEEIGRLHGLEAIKSIAPVPTAVGEVNQRYYYSEVIREALLDLGFSEVYTSSFRNKDEVKIKNALASDKGYLRSSLLLNLDEVRVKNAPQRDLLGLPAVKVFEIGTVFHKDVEEFVVGLAVQSGTGYKAKTDDKILNEALEKLATVLDTSLAKLEVKDGVAQFSLDAMMSDLPKVSTYLEVSKAEKKTYQGFSTYPAMSRDIALWATESDTVEEIITVLEAAAGELCVRITPLDRFVKEGRVSYAFRLVFQAADRTLTDVEVGQWMDAVYEAATNNNWETR